MSRLGGRDIVSTNDGRRMGDQTFAGARPPINPITGFFWAAAREHRLDILRCNECGYYLHPPRPVCRLCLSTDLSPCTVSGRGRLYSYTRSTREPHPWLGAQPYLLASVELAEQTGLRMVTNLVDVAVTEVRVGMDLEVTFLDVAPDLTLPMFRGTGMHE